MYEHITYENILQRMIDRVPNEIDKREGSVIYDALAPAAVELQLMYIELDTILRESFGDTASRDFLIRRTREKGIDPHPATYAVLKGEFTPAALELPIGSRFSLNELNYILIGKISDGIYQLQCETVGSQGNRYFGDLIPVDYIDGLQTAKLIEILEIGVDEEETEALRKRYLLAVKKPSTSGNLFHYQEWALSVSGVGDAKVFPLWDGAGTVKVVIANNNKMPASPQLVDETVEYIESVRPIGVEVTVVSCTAKTINVSASVILISGHNLQMVIEAFQSAVEEYFKSIAFSLHYVSIAKIGTLLLGVEGVIDYMNLQINNTTANIALSEEEIPILGTVELGV